MMFAVDSIPAVFGITEDPFIVLTSNLFAVLGLRSAGPPYALCLRTHTCVLARALARTPSRALHDPLLPLHALCACRRDQPPPGGLPLLLQLGARHPLSPCARKPSSERNPPDTEGTLQRVPAPKGPPASLSTHPRDSPTSRPSYRPRARSTGCLPSGRPARQSGIQLGQSLASCWQLPPPRGLLSTGCLWSWVTRVPSGNLSQHPLGHRHTGAPVGTWRIFVASCCTMGGRGDKVWNQAREESVWLSPDGPCVWGRALFQGLALDEPLTSQPLTQPPVT